MYGYLNVSELLGKTIVDIKQVGVEELYFNTSDGDTFKMYHEQDCCEGVYIESVVGDLEDLIGSPLLMAEEVTERGESSEWGDTHTWTFYKFATVKGYVTIRWLGESNGYYSESVDFVKLPNA